MSFELTYLLAATYMIISISTIDTFIHECGHAFVARFFDKDKDLFVTICPNSKHIKEFKFMNIQFKVGFGLNSNGTTDFDVLSSYTDFQISLIAMSGLGFAFTSYTIFANIISNLFHLNSTYFFIYSIILYLYTIAFCLFKSNLKGRRNDLNAIFKPREYALNYDQTKSIENL